MHRSFNKGYNERLFKGFIRKNIHLARFKWVARKVKELDADLSCVVELGCFDGKLLDFIPQPTIYYGYDAGWEGGLFEAKKKRQKENIKFFYCTKPEDINLDIEATSIFFLETLEHIDDPKILYGYIEKFYLIAKPGALLFITVPNEIGLVFLLKYLAKSLIWKEGRELYTFKEFIYQVLGKTDKVAKNQHKGFNWKQLLNLLSKYFKVLEVSGVQTSLLPPDLNINIGFVLRKE